MILKVLKENNVMSYRKELSLLRSLSVRSHVLKDLLEEMVLGDHLAELELLEKEVPMEGLDLPENLESRDTLAFQGK